MKRVTSAPKLGRPEKFKGGQSVLSVAVRSDFAEDLRRFMGYLLSGNGVRRSQGDVLTEALEAFRPFRDWKKKQRDAPG